MQKDMFLPSAVQAGQRAVVLGAGRSGMAAVRLLVARGATVTLLEKNPQQVHEDFRAEVEKQGVVIICGEHNTEEGAKHFAAADYIIPSPGIPIAQITPLLSPKADGAMPEVISEMELGWRHITTEPVLAITGTSGKTTTVSVAAEMLEAEGKMVFLGGNIGTPLSEYILDVIKTGWHADAVVLEVSSFQLQGCTTFAPHVAMLLNITENHLDYHADMQEYEAAKMQLFACQKATDVAIFHASLQDMAARYPVAAQKVYFEKDAQNFPERQLLGKHNAVNIEAAWQAVEPFGVSLEAARKAVASFMPLPHRLEKVRTLHDVLYVNDSKCTTVDAMRVALEAFDAPLFLLCGGKFKGGDLASLVPLLQQKVKQVVGLGASEKYFRDAWGEHVSLVWFGTMAEAVAHAQSEAKAGDVVLLAPATSSFDLYANYMQRGEDFKTIVGALD